MEAVELNRCQRTPWREELNCKELHGALGGEYDLEPRVNTALPRIYKCGIILVFKGGVFLDDPFCC